MLKTNGKFSPKKQYNIFSYYPEDIIEEVSWIINPEDKFLDTFVGLEYILDRYLEKKEAIDNCMSRTHSEDIKSYNYNRFLLLVDDVNGYCGIE